jgi:hypothetical protein
MLPKVRGEIKALAAVIYIWADNCYCYYSWQQLLSAGNLYLAGEHNI